MLLAVSSIAEVLVHVHGYAAGMTVSFIVEVDGRGEGIVRWAPLAQKNKLFIVSKEGKLCMPNSMM